MKCCDNVFKRKKKGKNRKALAGERRCVGWRIRRSGETLCLLYCPCAVTLAADRQPLGGASSERERTVVMVSPVEMESISSVESVCRGGGGGGRAFCSRTAPTLTLSLSFTKVHILKHLFAKRHLPLVAWSKHRTDRCFSDIYFLFIFFSWKSTCDDFFSFKSQTCDFHLENVLLFLFLRDPGRVRDHFFSQIFPTLFFLIYLYVFHVESRTLTHTIRLKPLSGWVVLSTENEKGMK